MKGTVGFDKDHLDVFIKPGTPEDWSGTVYVVNQNKGNGHFDEHKAVLGAASEDDARETYLANYQKGWDRVRSIVAMPVDEFKAWAANKGEEGPHKGELKAPSGVKSLSSIMVKRKTVHEETGEPLQGTVDENAESALRDIDDQLAKSRALLACLNT